MNKNLFKYLTFIGLIGLMFACSKDETKVGMLISPVVPTIQTVPGLTLKRTTGKDTLEFVGTPVNPGFAASANYFLEAGAAGTNFADPVVLVSGAQDKSMKITVGDLNGLLLKKFPADQVSSIDFRIRSVLVLDAGTGAPGTTASPLVFSSNATTVNVTIYGLPKLDLVNSGVTQGISSPLGDGKYAGFVKLSATKPFTLKDPDANVSYGNSAGKLAVNGAAITPSDNGWFKMAADTKALTFSTEAYMIGLIGSATSNGWNSPDTKMDYDAKLGAWVTTATLIDGEIKFRLNDGWAWNLGGTPNNLTQGGANLAVTAGTYTISLTIINGQTGTCTIVKK
jgi:starch-binding outer membrane protein SusE/F